MTEIIMLDDLINPIKTELTRENHSIELYGQSFKEEALIHIHGLKPKTGLVRVAVAIKENNEIYLQVGGTRRALKDIAVIP